MKQAIKQAQNLLLLFPNFTNPLNQIYEHEMQILHIHFINLKKRFKHLLMSR